MLDVVRNSSESIKSLQLKYNHDNLFEWQGLHLHVWDKAVESSTRNGRVATKYRPEVYSCAIHYRKKKCLPLFSPLSNRKVPRVVERRTAVRKVVGLSPRPDQHLRF